MRRQGGAAGCAPQRSSCLGRPGRHGWASVDVLRVGAGRAARQAWCLGFVLPTPGTHGPALAGRAPAALAARRPGESSEDFSARMAKAKPELNKRALTLVHACFQARGPVAGPRGAVGRMPTWRGRALAACPAGGDRRLPGCPAARVHPHTCATGDRRWGPWPPGRVTRPDELCVPPNPPPPHPALPHHHHHDTHVRRRPRWPWACWSCAPGGRGRWARWALSHPS